MFYVLYNTISKSLIDISTGVPDEFPPELTLVTIDGEVPNLYENTWDKNTLTFIRKHDVVRSLTILQFLSLFTSAERISIKEAAKANPVLADFFEMLNMAQNVDMDHETTIQGLQYLLYLGLLTPERYGEIIK